MAEKPQIAASFWNSLITIAAIVSSTVIIINYLQRSIENAVRPLMLRVEILEAKVLTAETKLTQLVYYNRVQDKTSGQLYDFINKTFKKDFVKPDELEFKEEK